MDDLEAAAEKGSSAGIPLLYPWANRLAGPTYRAAGREVVLNPSSPLLHVDEHGLPIHGVPWSRLAWDVSEAAPERLVAGLDWTREDLLSIFPYPHRLGMAVTLRPDDLTVETTLVAGPNGRVPVSFGFHPYFGIPGLPRAQWRLKLPAMRRLVLDPLGIPTGEDESFGELDGPIGDREFDDGFAVLDARPSFSVSGAGRRITVEFLEGYPYAQVFAPRGEEFLTLEPMTAPTNALGSGRMLRLVEPDAEFRATFRVRIDDTP